MDFRDITIDALVASVRAGERSAEEIAASTLARIAEREEPLNAFCARLPDDVVLAEARTVDARRRRGEDPGPLAGVPVGVKDLEDVTGLPTTYGSALREGAEPATGDSVVVARLRAAGAVIVGKTNTPEYGCKGITDNPLHGITRSPWDPERSPGGSSGGSGALLAAGLVALATGSDGGGSIRIPAAACGLSGFKASQGRVPLADASAPTTGLLAVRGPMARTIRDTVIALDVLRGDHRRDVFALPSDDGPWLPAYDQRTLPRRVLYSRTLGYARIDDAVRATCDAAVDRLRAAGVEVLEHEAVLDPHPVGHWWAMWTAAMARRLGHVRGTPDWECIDPPLREMVEYGLGVTGADYARAIDAAHEYNLQLETCFEGAPLILTPTLAGRVPRIGETGTVDGLPTAAWVEMTFGFNISRNPVATVNAGLDPDGLPVGLQVIGPQRADVEVLSAAGCFEEILGGPGRAPF